ncbi:MAG TPA: triple tyrosine motif-containing protein, partial [Cyclobacteriaceae bacterium]|nr:triple tyrosine motif-containing protein [Cyclobacteriaceae bacterium]
TAGAEPENQASAENPRSGRKGFLGIFKSRKKVEAKQTEPAAEQVTAVAEAESDATSKPGLIKRLFSRKDRGGDNEFEKITRIPHTDEYVRKERKILQSVEYLYKPVEGIQAKCKQLVIYRDKLLAVSTSGVFEIDNASASIVINEPVRFLYNDVANDRLIISGYDRSVKVYKLIGDVWVELYDQSFNEIISSIGMDNNHRLWLASPRLLYKITLSDEEFTIGQSFPIPNQMMDIPLMASLKDKFYFIYSMGYYYFDGDTVREDPTFKEALGLPVRSLQSSDGLTWIFNGKIWNRINPDGKIEAFEYLSLFPDIKYIDFNSEQDVFAILTQENKTYLYSHAEDHSFQPVNDLILKRITTNNGVVSLNSRIVLTYEDNSLSFKFTEPDYLGLLNVEYQYILKDEMKVWSDWTQLNSVNFSYLSPGIYSLTVRARDTFDRVKETREIEFRVRAPYWKRPWFYALEILMVGAMMVMVKRLRRINIRYPWIADGLGIFTLIIIIAMIQSTVAEYLMIESTPIIDLGINVVTALIAFPLEQKLRKILI